MEKQMKKIIIFNIKNTQEEYSKCLQFMQFRCIDQTNKSAADVSIIEIECNTEKDKYAIACEIEEKEYTKERIKELGYQEDVLWCFRINVEQEDDIVNLMYYYLIKQRHKDVLAILITPGIEYDMKISAYLTFEIEKDRNTMFIKTALNQVQTYGIVHRLAGSSLKERKEVRLTKFLPLIEVTDETYEFLSGTVEAAQKVMHDSPDNMWVKTVINICDGLFSQYNKRKSESFVINEEYVNTISNVTVLAYILFCSFRNHCPDRRNIFEITKIEQELSDARDVAEGALQILENIILHSQSKMGYFSFRIHNSTSKYLAKTYFDYVDKNPSDSFLEMFIADYYVSKNDYKNENILCKSFINNLRERSKGDKEIEPFILKYENLEVKHFFDSAIWNEYNAVSDNIIEHYGLQLFDKIVSSCNGCFEMVSSTQYNCISSQCYCSVEKTKEENSYVLPGTQYRVLLPIAERCFNQEYSGIDFYDYPKPAMLNPILKGIDSVDINFSDIIKKTNKKVQIFLLETLGGKNHRKALKAKLILELSEKIYLELEKSFIKGSHYVVHFILDEIKGAGLVEIIFKAFMKALIRMRTECGSEIKIYTAFGKLTKEFIKEFCYLMGIYYYKAEESEIMKNTEMYFWNIEYYDDLLISGKSLYTAHKAIMERAVLRGIYPRWLNFLDYVWEKYDYCHQPDSIGKPLMTLPYDVIVKDKGKTIFENVVSQVLQRPFADKELGCLLENTHVQLASKIHVSKFYNGQILFLNNYFTNYFSYLLVNKIKNYLLMSVDAPKKIVLVGYESYSEMILVKTSELLKSFIVEKNISSFYYIEPYIIGELIDKKLVLRSEEGRFDYENNLFCDIYQNCSFIFIIPLSSTMLTLEKMQSELEKILGIEINTVNNIANYVLILTRDIYQEKYSKENTDTELNCFMTGEEKEYWKEKGVYTIVTKKRGLTVNYFMEVCGSWEKASKCQQCFPAISIYEKPLIKTDITGLAPLTQLGQKKKWRKENNVSAENIKRLKSLSDVLTYNHIERGGNHYLYYFDTATFFYKNQDKINKWLGNIYIKEQKDQRCYSFIVSPLHATNAGFTEETNKVLFNNTAHIIRLDFCKTYRSNFMQQFSYLQILYQNIMQSSIKKRESKTEINFYFVDDEIISGKTLIRAKSLIEGLFEPLPKVEHIQVNVFKKIFVLISRLSDASKHNYIDEIKDYKSYVDFNVSVIQNHDDFCFMCKLVDKANHYKLMSATNKMDEAWGNIENKFKVKNYTWAEQKKDYKQDKYKSRMMAAHYSEAAMWNLSENATPEEYFQLMVSKLFYARVCKRKNQIVLSEKNQEIFISLIKTLSRPFFVYRNNAKEAALHLLIAFFECFLGMDYDNLWNDLNQAINVQKLNIQEEMKALWYFLREWSCKKDDTTYGLLLDLIEQLADMESGYIIRKDNIIKIFKYYNLLADIKYGKDDAISEEGQKLKMSSKKIFEQNYALYIKQLANEDADETKSLWVEKLFCLGKESDSVTGGNEDVFNDLCGHNTEFGRSVLIENTKIVYDGIKYMAETVGRENWDSYQLNILGQGNGLSYIEKEISVKIQNVYEQKFDIQLEFFKEILCFYELNQNINKICLEVLYYGLMFKINTERIPFENFYSKFYSIIKKLTGAEVQILMIPNKREMDEELFYQDAPCIIYDRRKEINIGREIKLQDKPLVESEYLRNIAYEYNTYFISDDYKQVIIKYIINLKHKDEKDNIYLILQYSDSQKIQDIIFDLRLILLCRSRTITRMKRDFNNNLFQRLWQTKKHSILLEHFKNVSHINPEENDVTSKTINYIWKIDENCRKSKVNLEMGLRIYKAVLLKMLADNNVSSIYHEILAKRLVSSYVIAEIFTAGGIFSDITDLKYIIHKKQGKTLDEKWWNTGSDLPSINIDKDVLDGYMYYIAPNSFRTQLLIISLILNAYKHGNNMKPIHIYREIGPQTQEHKMDYLCISNGITAQNKEMIIGRIDEHIKKPVTARKTNGSGDKSEGITLFSLKHYCQKIADELNIGVPSENLMKYEIVNDIIIFKVLILKGGN